MSENTRPIDKQELPQFLTDYFWDQTSISSAQFIGAYLESALQQLEQSAQQEKKLNAVSAITNSLSKK